MKTYALSLLFPAFLQGCNALPVTYDSGAHWALIENPVAYKCVMVKMREGTLSIGGLVSWISDVTVDGKDVEYQSIGRMCQTTQEGNAIRVDRTGTITVETPE